MSLVSPGLLLTQPWGALGQGLGPSVVLNAVLMHKHAGLKSAIGAIPDSSTGFFTWYSIASNGDATDQQTDGSTDQFNMTWLGQHYTGASDAEHPKGMNVTFDATGYRDNWGDSSANGMDMAVNNATTILGNGGTTAGQLDFNLLAWDLAHPAGFKKAVHVRNGVVISAGGISGDTNGSVQAAFSLAEWWINNNDGTNAQKLGSNFPIAQVIWDASASSATMVTNALTANNAIDINFVKKFYDTVNNRPVATATIISNLGFTPQIVLDGPAATFATNQGSLGNIFTVQGSAATAASLKQLYDYQFGPGATANRPRFLWQHAERNSLSIPPYLTGGATGWTGFRNYGKPITATTRMFLRVKLYLGNQHNDMNLQIDKGWARVTGCYQQITGTGIGGNYALFYKDADASDVTAQGQRWTNRPTITWTANSTGTDTWTGWMYDFFAFDKVTTMAGNSVQIWGTAVSGFPTPAVTIPANALLLSTICCESFPSEGFATTGIVPPSGMTLLWAPPVNGGGSITMWETPSAGAGAIRTWTNAGVNGRQNSIGEQLVLT